MLENYLISQYDLVELVQHKGFTIEQLIFNYVAENLRIYFPPEDDFCPTESQGYFIYNDKYYLADLECEVGYEKTYSGHKIYYPERLYSVVVKEIDKPKPKPTFEITLVGLLQSEVDELESKYFGKVVKLEQE